MAYKKKGPVTLADIQAKEDKRQKKLELVEEKKNRILAAMWVMLDEERPRTVLELSRIAKMSTGDTSMLFKELYGMSVAKYFKTDPTKQISKDLF